MTQTTTAPECESPPEREIRYETDVRSDSLANDLPSKVRFVVSESAAKEIIRLSSLVAVK